MSAEVWSALIGGVSGMISVWIAQRLTARGATAASMRDNKHHSQYVPVQCSWPQAPAVHRDLLSASYDAGTSRTSCAGCWCTISAQVSSKLVRALSGMRLASR